MNKSENTAVSKKEITTEHIRDFFDELMSVLAKDKQDMLIGVADENKVKMYESMIRKDKDYMVNTFVKAEKLRTLSEMLQDFLSNLNNNKLPNKIAVSFEDSSLNVIVVVNDDDDDATKEIIDSKSKVITKYFSRGFKIETKIIESENVFKLPENYKEFPLKMLA